MNQSSKKTFLAIKNGVKSIQTAGYNGARLVVYTMNTISKHILPEPEELKTRLINVSAIHKWRYHFSRNFDLFFTYTYVNFDKNLWIWMTMIQPSSAESKENPYFKFHNKQKMVVHFLKVHIFWEGHKILRNLHLTFVLCSASQK